MGEGRGKPEHSGWNQKKHKDKRNKETRGQDRREDAKLGGRAARVLSRNTKVRSENSRRENYPSTPVVAQVQ